MKNKLLIILLIIAIYLIYIIIKYNKYIKKNDKYEMFNNNIIESQNIIEQQNTPLVIKELPSVINKIPLIVISLDRATERKDYINKVLQHEFSYFKAVDGTNMNEEDLLLKSKYICSDTNLRDGQIGVYLSHIKIWIDIYEKSQDNVHLIFEDDIVLKYNIHKILNIINKIDFNDYDIVFTGHCAEGKGELKQEILDESAYFNLHNSQWPRCLHAYMITKNGARKAFEYISSINNTENKINLPIDEIMGFMIGRGILKSLSFHDTLINQPWQEPVNTLNFGSYTGSN